MRLFAWGCCATLLAGAAGCGSCSSGSEPSQETPAPAPSTTRPFRLHWDGGFKRLHLPRDGGGFDAAVDLDGGLVR